MIRRLLAIAICLWSLPTFAEHPKVRAITAFVHVDREHYRAQVGEAVTMLRSAKSAYEKAGFEKVDLVDTPDGIALLMVRNA